VPHLPQFCDGWGIFLFANLVASKLTVILSGGDRYHCQGSFDCGRALASARTDFAQDDKFAMGRYTASERALPAR
jgi:hypothetical protein